MVTTETIRESVKEMVELKGIFLKYIPKEGNRPQKIRIDCDGTLVEVADFNNIIPDEIKNAEVDATMLTVEAKKTISESKKTGMKFTNFIYKSMKEIRPFQQKPKIKESFVKASDMPETPEKKSTTPITDMETDKMVKAMEGWYTESYDFVKGLIRSRDYFVSQDVFASMVATVFIQRSRIESRRY